jgi:peroxiredoxin
MTIKVGDRLPNATVRVLKEGGVDTVSTEDFFKGKKVALFAVPGAFTSTCSAKHLPSFTKNSEALRKKGVDAVVCLAVNDAAVMKAWGEEHGAAGKVDMMSDGNGEFAKAMGLDVDLSAHGMGTRARRFSMLVDNGVVKSLNLEEPGGYGASSGETLLSQI